MNAKNLFEPRHDEVVLAATVFVFLTQLLNRHVDEVCAKDVKQPRIALKKRGTEDNEYGPEYKRQDDAQHQQFLLHLFWHLELRHDDKEHKDVVG